MRFALVNEGQSAPLASQVTAEWLSTVAAACVVQLNRDVSAYWGGNWSGRVASGPADLTPGEIAFALIDAFPNEPNAVAYHDTQGGSLPYALLSLAMCNTLDDITEAISHELNEIDGDDDCNVWRDNGQGKEYAQEISDPVESNSYRINGVSVSDFVLPAFFKPTAAAPFCFTAAIGAGPDCAAPFATASGGYQVVRTSGGGETQIYGEIRPSRLAKKRHWSSRTFRRGARV